MNESWRKRIAERCTECGLCRKECAFLRKYGSPKSIAAGSGPAADVRRVMAFECSLCELCAAVCPAGLNPASMFREMRQEADACRGRSYRQHAVILSYEKRGTSRRYSYYGLPEACDTVLFPGCTLAGTRSRTVQRLYLHLAQTFPSLGMVLDCCTKPSHDLGRQDHFLTMFGEMRRFLLDHGVRQVLVACASCHKTFREYGEPLKVRSVYEVLAATGLPSVEPVAGTVTIHDPCAVRFETSLQDAVRTLVAERGLCIEEMPHSRDRALCCGEGGAVGFFAPDLARNWSSMRQREAQHKRLLAYCAGCAGKLGKSATVAHVLDLAFEPAATLAGKVKVARAPWTYWQRLRLKKYCKKTVPAVITRERPPVCVR